MTGPPPAKLRRELGLFQLTASAVGLIIGAGIYVLIGEATALAGEAVWVSFIVAGLVCAVTALSYAELASMFPRAGAEFEYARQAFPEWVAFLAGWAMMLGLTVAAAAVSLGFARYLQEFVEVDERIAATAMLASLVLIASGGIKQSALVTVALSVVQVGGLLAVAAIGIPHIGREPLLSGVGSTGVISAAALVFFAFVGFDEINTLAEETKDPARTLPRAILLALSISTVLYVVVGIGAVSVIGARDLAASDRPLTDVVAHVLGGPAGSAVASVALLTTLNTTLMAITAASRIVYGMATERSLPPVFGRIFQRTAVPLPALLAVTAVAVAFAVSSDIKTVAGATDVFVYFVFIIVNAAVLVLRRRRPQADRPFRVRGSIARVPVAPIAGIALSVALLTFIEAEALLMAILLGALGLVAYAVTLRVR